jgi:predicted HTH domain antitoxin
MLAQDLIRKEIQIVPKIGFYESEDEFISEAINTLMASRKDLRTAVAAELYNNEEISFGKACEIASLNIEEMKEVLHKRKIKRKVSASLDEIDDMAAGAIRIAGR